MNPHIAVHAAQPVKMNGVFVRLTPTDFQNLLNRQDDLAVVVSETKFFSTTYTYVTAHKGLVFYCKSNTQLSITGRHEVIEAVSITLPT